MSPKLIAVSIIGFLIAFNWSALPAQALYATCKPRFSGTWTLTQNCELARSTYINGDIVAGPYNILVPTGLTLSFNLAAYKATFTSGYIWLAPSAKVVHDTTSVAPYYSAISYTAGAQTNCTAFYPGTQVLATATPPAVGVPTIAFASSSFTSVAANGTMYCAYP